ncbi:MAG: VanZ family protein [Bacteroidales bacterium]|nr:VanZ family protein [Bacteroidales bacterium]
MKIINYWKPITIALLILYGSTTSGSDLNKLSIFQIPNIDKLLHFSLYFLLSVSLQSSFLRNELIHRKKQIHITLTMVILYGLLMEVFQYYLTSGRSAEILDIIANSAGCILGVASFRYLKNFNLTKFL